MDQEGAMKVRVSKHRGASEDSFEDLESLFSFWCPVNFFGSPFHVAGTQCIPKVLKAVFGLASG